MKKMAYLIMIATTMVSCGNRSKQAPPEQIDEARLKKRIEEVQKPFIVMENDQIDAYIREHGLIMQTTGAGLRYQLLKANPKGKVIVTKNEVKINYKISLLNGKLCYSSDQEGSKTFLVDFDHVESGLHSGIKLLHEGEKVLFIMPSHLAYGLVGDGKNIPPKATLVYEVEVLAVK